mmetsp:Transcript_88897/g.254141  ORF Transcript_88897/g.254141 Transcript_88897/m.254141 type:complete len:281 (-) Transcript_88897:1331-2173(-)
MPGTPVYALPIARLGWHHHARLAYTGVVETKAQVLRLIRCLRVTSALAIGVRPARVVKSSLVVAREGEAASGVVGMTGPPVHQVGVCRHFHRQRARVKRADTVAPLLVYEIVAGELVAEEGLRRARKRAELGLTGVACLTLEVEKEPAGGQHRVQIRSDTSVATVGRRVGTFRHDHLKAGRGWLVELDAPRSTVAHARWHVVYSEELIRNGFIGGAREVAHGAPADVGVKKPRAVRDAPTQVHQVETSLHVGHVEGLLTLMKYAEYDRCVHITAEAWCGP